MKDKKIIKIILVFILLWLIFSGLYINDNPDLEFNRIFLAGFIDLIIYTFLIFLIPLIVGFNDKEKLDKKFLFRNSIGV